jgi:hypothetical protein
MGSSASVYCIFSIGCSESVSFITSWFTQLMFRVRGQDGSVCIFFEIDQGLSVRLLCESIKKHCVYKEAAVAQLSLPLVCGGSEREDPLSISVKQGAQYV